MSTPTNPSSLALLSHLLVLCCALLCACTSIHIHDEARAQLASSSRADYDAAKITEIIEADYKNAAALLVEEVAATRDNFAIQVDFATLAIANDTTPMARTYTEARARMTELGFDSIKELRSLFQRDAFAQATQRTLQSYAKVFREKKVDLSGCSTPFEELKLPDDLNQNDRALLKRIYPQYQALCAKVQEPQLPARGLIVESYRSWRSAADALKATQADQDRAAQLLADARSAYEDQVKAATTASERGASVSKSITDKAQALLSALQQAKKLSPDAVHAEEIDAVVDILTATAQGNVDAQDPRLARAVLVAKQIPSIAGDIANVEATRNAPPVSGLLLVLRQRTVLLETSKKLAALAEERVAVQKAKYDAYSVEANHWLRFHDAVCSYAALSDQQKHPGETCNEFVPPDKNNRCVLAGAAIANCALGKPWKEALHGNEPGETRRELYKGVTHYLQAIAIQAVPIEEAFREIDIRQRETLVAKSSALDSWNNLVSVPLDQLDGYYKGGVKPVEIADLILRALTFTAIAIGVSK